LKLNKMKREAKRLLLKFRGDGDRAREGCSDNQLNQREEKKVDLKTGGGASLPQYQERKKTGVREGTLYLGKENRNAKTIEGKKPKWRGA